MHYLRQVRIIQDDRSGLPTQLEEESLEDTDYYINPATLDMFEERGADAGLLTMLRNALGDREDMDIRWSRG